MTGFSFGLGFIGLGLPFENFEGKLIVPVPDFGNFVADNFVDFKRCSPIHRKNENIWAEP